MPPNRALPPPLVANKPLHERLPFSARNVELLCLFPAPKDWVGRGRQLGDVAALAARSYLPAEAMFELEAERTTRSLWRKRVTRPTEVKLDGGLSLLVPRLLCPQLHFSIWGGAFEGKSRVRHVWLGKRGRLEARFAVPYLVFCSSENPRYTVTIGCDAFHPPRFVVPHKSLGPRPLPPQSSADNTVGFLFSVTPSHASVTRFVSARRIEASTGASSAESAN